MADEEAILKKLNKKNKASSQLPQSTSQRKKKLDKMAKQKLMEAILNQK